MTLPPPITSRSNARVKALRAGFSGDAAQPGELVGIEGETLLAEALRSGLRVDSIFVRQGSEAALEVPELHKTQPVPVFILSKDVFASAVHTGSPQGIAALIAIPPARGEEAERRAGVVLVLESMQDPGNLGTLLRAAEAFGVSQVMATPDTVNPWNPKAIRASTGSVFRVPVRRLPLNEAKDWMTTRGVRLYAAVAQVRDAVACMDADLAAPCALMIGNEGAGLSPAALALADERIHIPCRTESLNAAAAGATLLYEAMRQRLAKMIPTAPSGERA
ncbi:MAG TPA: RNA methyltransferase [Acidobacteriaceae bacterium]|jgi:TrmH family RNA methyltransferase|nr:RNA methyltransferase [Acidobacteriaceae bacterium]